MKKLLFIFFVLITTAVFSQDQDLVQANRYFERTWYSKAIPLYETAIRQRQTPEIVLKLADVYYFTNDMINAEKWYRILVGRQKRPDLLLRFRYMHALKAVGKYDEALVLNRNWLKAAGDVVAIADFERDVKELKNIVAIGNRFEIKNLAVNTEAAEFAVVPYKGSLVYTGSAVNSATPARNYKWNDEAYLDLMMVHLQPDGTVDSVAVPFSKEINTALHEGNAVFTADGRTVYFTRNNFRKGKRGSNSAKISNLQLYRATIQDGGTWSAGTALPFNHQDYSVEHPALSPDGKTLYFASDMPGTYGSFDLFAVAVSAEGFGTPVNLGKDINTEHKEQFPFISKDNKLYFASDGHAGFGALDVFVSEINGSSYSKPKNVGLPVNSGADDFSFYIDSDTQKGYFASNRSGGKGSDDIYAMSETKPLLIEDCMQYISGLISDIDTGLPLTGVLVVLEDSSKKEVTRFTTVADGAFNFTVQCSTSFRVLVSKELYSSDSKTITITEERHKSNDASMKLKSEEALVKEKAIVEARQKEEAAIAAVQRKKDADLLLIQQKKEAEKQAVAAKEAKIATLLAQEKDVVKDKERLIIKTDPIYFDYDLWYIRKESKPILDRVIALMKKYPEMVVETGSHTDVRGNNNYNLELSAKRAASTRAYFIVQGIPENRIHSKGYGETVQIIKCVPEDGCTEEQHELNRRSEFVIRSL